MQNIQLLAKRDSLIKHSLTIISNKYIKKAHGREYYGQRKQIQWFLKKNPYHKSFNIIVFIRTINFKYNII